MKSNKLQRIKNNLPEYLRYFFSIFFFYLAIVKGVSLWKSGLAPYYHSMVQLGIPKYFGVYIVVALIIELILAIGLWYKNLFLFAIASGIGLVISGVFVSIASLIFRWNSDCGCGLLGTNEYGLIAQKIVLLIGLIYLIRKRKQLFVI